MFTEEHQPEHNTQGSTWLVTFADVIALLLAFFVMLFSMSNIQTETWDAIISQISSSETPKKEDVQRPQATKNIATVKLIEALSLDYLANVLEEHLSADALLNDASVHRLDGLVVVSLPSDTMFPAGEVGLTVAAREALFRMGGIIASIGNRIDVRGHTDPATTTDGSYASKWTISLARAAAVANELRRTGYSRQIPIYGLADTRFSHLDEQIPETARFVLARRVDVVVHPHSGDI
jgi:chemotaxis protein MotB